MPGPARLGRRNVLVLDDRIAERSSLSDRRGAGDNGQEIAPIDLCVSYGSLLSRCDRACADVCCLAFSCWLPQELFVVLPRYFLLAPAVVLLDVEHLVWQAAPFGSKIYFDIRWRSFFLSGLWVPTGAFRTYRRLQGAGLPGSARARGQGVEIIRQMGFTYLDSTLCASRQQVAI